MWQLEEENIPDSDLEIYIKQLEKLKKDFSVRFEDREKMYVSDWIVTRFDLEIENADIDFHLKDELIDVCGSRSHCSEIKASAMFRVM